MNAIATPTRIAIACLAVVLGTALMSARATETTDPTKNILQLSKDIACNTSEMVAGQAGPIYGRIAPGIPAAHANRRTTHGAPLTTPWTAGTASTRFGTSPPGNVRSVGRRSFPVDSISSPTPSRSAARIATIRITARATGGMSCRRSSRA